MTDNSYKTQPLRFFQDKKDLDKLIEEGEMGPWYFCDVESFAEWTYNGNLESINKTGLHIARWWRKNSKPTNQLFYCIKEDERRLVFGVEKISREFRSWYAEQQKTDYNDTKIWPGWRSFIKEVEETGRTHIYQKLLVEDLLECYQSEGVITEEIYDLYWWMQENIGKVYYWDDDFYFTSDEDAMAFKLKWL